MRSDWYIAHLEGSVVATRIRQKGTRCYSVFITGPQTLVLRSQAEDPYPGVPTSALNLAENIAPC